MAYDKQLIQLRILEELKGYAINRGYTVFPKLIDQFEEEIFDADNIISKKHLTNK